MKSTMEEAPNPQTPKLKKKKRKSLNLDLTIKQLKEDPQKNAPFMGYYPSGFDPKTHEGSESEELKLYRNQKKQKRIELVVKPQGFEVDYVGSNYCGEAAAPRMNSFALGVVCKSSHLLKIVPITANKVLRLQPLARVSDINDKEPDTPAKIDTAEEKRLKRNILTDRYGTKTASKKDKKAMELYRKEDPDAQLELNQVIEETPIDKSALASTDIDASCNIPPYDLSATTPEKAYVLDKIILKGEWNYVTDILELLQAGQETKPDVYPSFVCNRFYKVELNKDEAEKSRLAGILSYITHLVNFKTKYSIGGGASSSKHHKGLPSILFQRFTNMFLDTEKNRLSDEKIGSLISYVLVLTLFVDEFQTDFTDIAKDLKMSAFSLRPYLENLGCRFQRRNDVTLATLPVPLKFPTIRKKRRRG